MSSRRIRGRPTFNPILPLRTVEELIAYCFRCKLDRSCSCCHATICLTHTRLLFALLSSEVIHSCQPRLLISDGGVPVFILLTALAAFSAYCSALVKSLCETSVRLNWI